MAKGTGTIDSLNFEVLLLDDKFKKSVEADLKIAQDLNTKLTNVLNLKKRLNSETTQQIVNAEKVRQAEQKTAQEIAKTALQQQKVATEVERTRKIQEGHTGAVKSTNAALGNTQAILRTLSQLTGVTFSVTGLRRFLAQLIEITGQFEVQRMALRNMLQDVDGADKIFEDLYRFSSDSTYRFSELAKYAKQLAAFNIGKDSLLETTKMLGDVASGVGVSMDRVILAYGHVKSSGFLRGIQLRSFSQNGIPVLEELAKQFSEIEKRTVSLGEIFDKMMKREIPFEMVEEAFKRMTSEGGKFYQMQEVLAKTLAGQINILKGRWENMLAAIGQANSGILKGAVSSISNLLVHYDELGKKIVEIVSLYGAYRAAIYAAELAAKGHTAAEMAEVTVMEVKNKLMLKNPYALLAAAIITVTAAVWKMIDGMKEATAMQETMAKEQSKYTTDLTKSVSELDLLYGKLKLAAKGTSEYDTAVRSIQSRYGEYITQLQNEGVAVSDLAAIYDQLRQKVEDAAKARFIASARHSLEQTYGEQIGEIFDKNGRFSMVRVVNQLDLDAKEAGFLKMMIAGVTSEENLRKLEEATSLFEKIDKGFISYGAGDTGPVKAAKYIENLRLRVAELNREFNDSNDIIETFVNALTKADDNGGGNQDTNGVTIRLSSIIAGIRKTEKDIARLEKKAATVGLYIGKDKNGNEINEKQELANLRAAREEDIKAYEEIMGKGSFKKYEKSRADADKEAIQALKTQCTLLEKYKDAYDKLEPIMGRDATIGFLSKMFKQDESTFANLDKDIADVVESLRSLGEQGNEAADAIEARLGTDAVSKLVALDKAAKKAEQDFANAEAKLNEYLTKDFGIEGERVAAKISKALADLKTKNAGVDAHYGELVKTLEKERQKVVDDYIKSGHSAEEADAYWDEYKTRMTDALKVQAAKEKAQNAAVMKERVRGMAKALFDEQMEGFDLSNWTDKTLSQIQDIKDAMEHVTLPDDLRKALGDNLELAGMLYMELKKIAGENLTNTVAPEMKKSWASTAQNVAKYIGKAAESMRQLAEATGDSALSDASKAASAISENLSAAAAGFQVGGAWGAVIAGVLDAVVQIVNGISQAEAEAMQMRNTIREIRYEMAEARWSDSLSAGDNGIFGENFIENVRAATKAIDDSKNALKSANAYMEVYHRYVRFNAPFNIWGLLDKEKGHAVIKTDHSFWNGDTWTKLEDIAKNLNMELYQEGGYLNPTFLEKVIELYGDANEQALDWLLKEKEAANEYNAAIETIHNSTKELFDSLSSDMTDQFIENFKEMGNAVDDLGDVFENLGETILRSLLQSYILDKVLNQYEDEANSMLAAYAAGEMSEDDYAKWLKQFTENVQRDSENQSAAINGLINAFASRGLIINDEEDENESNDKNSLGAGIKSITEETASLLASYINAMRADLSFMRTLQEAGWANIEQLTGVLIPSLADYAEQIAANTYNASQDTAAILTELRSVIGPAGQSGDVLRVETV